MSRSRLISASWQSPRSAWRTTETAKGWTSSDSKANNVIPEWLYRSFKIAILINPGNLSWIQKMKAVRAEKLWSFSALRNTLTFKAVQRYLAPRLRFIRRFSFLCIWLRLCWLFFSSEVLCSRNHRKRRNRRRWRCLKRCGCLHAWHLDGVVNTFIIALFFTLYGRQGSLYQLMYQIHYSKRIIIKSNAGMTGHIKKWPGFSFIHRSWSLGCCCPIKCNQAPNLQ